MFRGNSSTKRRRLHLQSLLVSIVIFPSLWEGASSTIPYPGAISNPVSRSHNAQSRTAEEGATFAEHDESFQTTQQMSSNDDNVHEKAQSIMRNYFDSILSLRQIYGPDIITIQDATEMFPILANSSSPCPFIYETPNTQQNEPRHCFTPIITIYDRISNSPKILTQQQEQQGIAVEQSLSLPEVLLLSALDNTPQEMDLIGPSSIYETLKLLLECARCESLSPWVNITNSGSNDTTNHAMECRQSLQRQGIEDSVRKWIARLAVTRRIVALPIANVAGFYYKLANELTTDGNQPQFDSNQQLGNGAACDFPYPSHWSRNGSNKSTCMNTYPAQIINELFHSHAFQLGVSFHGSISAYNGWIEVPRWDVNSTSRISFDEEAMRDISGAMSVFGAGTPPYRVSVTDLSNADNSQSENDCNAAIMENWAFAAGFSDASSEIGGSIWLDKCICDTNSTDMVCAYPSERTNLYDGSSLRSFVARVVAPPRSNTDVFCLPGFDNMNMKECDHYSDHHLVFSRNSPLGLNVRMSLIGTELVEPRTSIRSIAGVELRDDDVVPFSPRLADTCQRTRVLQLPESPAMKNVTLTWSVGGALTVDETAIMYGKWEILDKKIFNCVNQPTKQELDAFFYILRDFEQLEGETEEQMETEVTFTPVQSGATRWHSSHRDDKGDDVRIQPETRFSVTLDLSHYKAGDRVAIYSLARVDQKWVHGYFSGDMSSNENPPESNIVNARTNPEWIIQHGLDHPERGSTIKGRLDFFSVPVTIEIGKQPGFFEGTDITESSIRLSDSELLDEASSEDGLIFYSLFMAVLTIVSIFTCIFCRDSSDGTDIFAVLYARRKIMHQRISVDEFFRNEAAELELT
eukprot:CCRYP_003559-RA/>CCRYP_003559-RA protein AED:0.01 eAED:0.01 QI:117/1/1/1/0.33/0.25/4/4045/860